MHALIQRKFAGQVEIGGVLVAFVVPVNRVIQPRSPLRAGACDTIAETAILEGVGRTRVPGVETRIL